MAFSDSAVKMLTPDDVINRVVIQLEDAREYRDVFGERFYKNIKKSAGRLNGMYQDSANHKHLISIISDSLKGTLSSGRYKPASCQISTLIYAFKILNKKDVTVFDLEDTMQKFVAAGISQP